MRTLAILVLLAGAVAVGVGRAFLEARCRDRHPPFWWSCNRQRGHPGWHQNKDGNRWP